MFSRQRTSSVSSGADRAAHGRPPLLQPEDRPTDMASNTSGIGNEPRRKSFMGIHFGGHKDKEKDKMGKEGSRVGRQSMDQQRQASFTSSPVRNSMSDVARPRFPSNQGSNGSPLAGNRIVSQPSYPSFGAGRPGNDERPEYQERERSVSLTAASPPVPLGNTAFQGPVGRTTSPRTESTNNGQPAMGLQRLQPHRPSSDTFGREERSIPEREMQGGSFAVASRSSSSLDPGPPSTTQPQQPAATRSTSQQFPQPHQSPTGSQPRPRTASSASRTGNPALTQVLQSYIDLNTIQANKLYASSPPELEMIFARQTNGAQPKYVFCSRVSNMR